MMAKNISNKSVFSKNSQPEVQYLRRKLLQKSWIVPVVTVVGLPAHAQTSEVPASAASPNSAATEKEQVTFVAEITKATVTEEVAVEAEVSQFAAASKEAKIGGEEVEVVFELTKSTSEKVQVARKVEKIASSSKTGSISPIKAQVSKSELEAVGAKAGETVSMKARMVSSKFVGEASASKQLIGKVKAPTKGGTKAEQVEEVKQVESSTKFSTKTDSKSTSNKLGS